MSMGMLRTIALSIIKLCASLVIARKPSARTAVSGGHRDYEISVVAA